MYDAINKRLDAQEKKIDQFMKYNELAYNRLFAELFYQKFKVSDDVTFDFLKQAPDDEEIQLPSVASGVISTKKDKQMISNELIYNTRWSSGATLLNHFHSDCEETIKAIKGSFLVIIENKEKFIIEEGEKILIAAGLSHQTSSLEKVHAQIIFKKVKNHLTSSHT